MKDEQFKEQMNSLRSTLQLLTRVNFCVEAKMAACNLSVASALLYRATLGTWSTGMVSELDGFMNEMYRRVLKMRKGTAETITNLPVGSYGLGCTSIREKLFRNKWAAAHRNEGQQDMIAALLQRPMQQRGIVHYPGQLAVIRHLEGTVTWCTTMLQEAHSWGLHLRKGGVSLEGTTSEMIYHLMGPREMSKEEQNSMASLAVCTVGDMTEVRQGRRVWADSVIGLERIRRLLMSGSCPEGRMILRPGQCWVVKAEAT